MTNIFYVNGYRKGFAIRQCLCKFFYIDTYKSKFEKKTTYRPCRSAIHEVCIHSNLNFLFSI